jgi:ribosome recycling factor
MAHDNSRQEAQVMRKKKKEKKAARKGKHTAEESPSSSPAATTTESEWDDHDEYHEEDDHEQDVTVLPDSEETKKRMLKIVDSFISSLKNIRGAEPSPDLFDDIVVDAYGEDTPLKAVAQVVIVSSTQATATCFDPALAKGVMKAIRDKLSLNPSVEEGGMVKIPIPRVSMETRQELATVLTKRAEGYRQRIRKVRRIVLDVVKQGVAGKLEGISKDDAFRVKTEIESTTDQVIHTLNEAADKKHASIMQV